LKIKIIISLFLCFFVSSTTGQENINIKRPEEIACLQQHSGTVNCISFSHDGQFFISGGEDAKMFLWDWDTKRVIRSYERHTDGINCLIFSPDDKFIVSGGADNILRLWEVETGKTIRYFKGHTDAIESVVFSLDGQSLASGGRDKTTRIWNVNSGTQEWIDKKHYSPVNAIAYLSEDHEIITISGIVLAPGGYIIGERVYIQSFKFKEAMVQIDSIDTGLINCAAFSSNHRYLLLGAIYQQMEVLLWDLEAHKIIHKWKIGNFPTSVCFSPDNRMAVAGYLEGIGIYVWNIATGKQLAQFIGHKSEVSAIAVCPNSQYVVSGSKDMTIRIWRLPNP
jgi:WD40 repeat protein